MRRRIVILSPYEEAKKAGLVSIKDKSRSNMFDRWNRKEADTCFWPKCPPGMFDAHPLAKKAHVYGSSLK